MEDVAAWRRARRAELIERRMATPLAERRAWGGEIERHLHQIVGGYPPSILSSYWPFRAEFDPRPFVRDLIGRGWQIALPVVIQKKAPLEFRLWTPDAPMENGIWDIPVPRDGAVVRPGVMLAPVVGFDDACFRLGYGGGYYDRTLAVLAPRPVTIGIGFEFSHLETIYPEPHDQRLDMIVTEAGVRR
jgi:5-formyltetrahydrofolate cyclo-ligase